MKGTGWMGAVLGFLKEIFGYLPSPRLESVWVEEPLSKRLLGLEATRPEKEDGGKWVLVFTVFDSDRTYTFGVLIGTYILSFSPGKRDLLWNEGIPIALVYDDAMGKIKGWVHFAEQAQRFGESSGYSFPLRPLEEFRPSADLEGLARREETKSPVLS